MKAWIFVIVNHQENLAERTFVCLEPIVLLFDLVYGLWLNSFATCYSGFVFYPVKFFSISQNSLTDSRCGLRSNCQICSLVDVIWPVHLLLFFVVKGAVEAIILRKVDICFALKNFCC